MKKKIISLLTILCMVMTLIPATVATSNAATESVPTVRTTAPESTNQYFYGPNNWHAANGYAAGPSGGNCTWYAYGRAYEYTGKVQNLSLNNACTWYSAWNGEKGQTPKAGSIICWSYDGGGDGHVAFVEKVKDNGDIFISNSGWTYIPSWNHGSGYTSTQNGNMSYGWLPKGSNNWQMFSNMNFQGFIYLDGTPAKWPTVIASNVASTGKVKLSWYKKSDAAEYWVYRSTSKNGTYKKMKETTSTTYTNTSAVASKLYYYKVKAVDKKGKLVAWSDKVSRTCDLARPTITSASKITSTGNIKVVWKDVKNANRYEVYRSTDNSNYTKIATYDTKMNTGNSHSCINSKNVVAGTKYYYRIKAINTNNSGADSALSLAVSCTAGSASTTTTVTGGAEKLVAHARSHIGDKYNTFDDREDFTTDWCSQFIQHCAAKAGLGSIIPTSGCAVVKDMVENVVNQKKGKITFVNQSYYNEKKADYVSSRVSYNASYIPQKGDLVVFGDTPYNNYPHIGIVASTSASATSAVNTIEGNTIGSHYTTSEVYEYTNRGGNIVAYVTPNYGSGWPNVTAENVESTGKIKLTWSKKSGAAEYWVYRATSKNGTYTKMKETTSTTYTNTSAVASKMYYYKVKAVDKNGKLIAWSNVVNRTCDLARPSITYAGNESATGNIVIKWKDVKNANRYEVYRSTTDSNYVKIATFDTKMNTGKTYSCINSNNVTPGVKYYYKIKAINTNNSGADSALSTAWSRTADLAQPVVTSSINPKTGKVVLSWTDVKDADSYKIYIATSKTGTYKYNATWNSPGNSGETHVVPHNSGVAGKTYYYKITACKSDNEYATSAYSKYVYRTCDLAQPDVTLNYSSKGNIVVSWPKITGADRYEIYRSTNPDTGFERIYSGTSVSVTNTKNLTSGTTYYYKVRAIDSDKSAANSAYSEVDCLTYY